MFDVWVWVFYPVWDGVFGSGSRHLDVVEFWQNHFVAPTAVLRFKMYGDGFQQTVAIEIVMVAEEEL